MDAHERVPEPVDAAVALVPRPGLGAHGRGVLGPPEIERRRDARHQPVCEPGAAPGVVAPRQVVLHARERHPGVLGVRPPDGVHEAVAALQEEPALAPGGSLDRLHRRPRIVAAGDERLELAQVAVARGLREEPTALLHRDSTDGRVSVVAGQDEDRRRHHGNEGRQAEQEEESGPPRRAALLVRCRYGLPARMTNCSTPWPTLPLMSVAVHLNVVVVETTNDWPGSRGPVESHSGDVSVGFDPSVV